MTLNKVKEGIIKDNKIIQKNQFIQGNCPEFATVL